MCLVFSFICVVFLCLFIILSYYVWVLLSQASGKVEFFPWRRLNSFFLLVSSLLRLVQWLVWASYRVRFVLSFLFVCLFFLMGKAEWDCTPICWWLGLYFCFVCCSNEASCTGATGSWVMQGRVFNWFHLCEFSLSDTPRVISLLF